MSKLTQNGTDGRVYGGDPNLVHINDGERAALADRVVNWLDDKMRISAYRDRRRTAEQLYGNDAQKLCPGCTDVVLFDMALILARRSGRSLSEMGNTLSKAFAEVAAHPDDANVIEEIKVVLDPC